jgi:thioredoxin 1
MELTDSTLNNTLENNKVVLVDFWAEWCGPCRILGPTIEELETDFKDKAFIGKINISENPESPSKYGVRSIPTVIIYKNGEEVERVVGLRDKTFYSDKINYYLN